MSLSRRQNQIEEEPAALMKTIHSRIRDRERLLEILKLSLFGIEPY